MLLPNYILAVFEGEKTEKQIFDNLTQYYLNEKESTIVYAFHCSDIYALYHKMKKDEDLELFGVLKEDLSATTPKLNEIKPSEVQEIHLFFDYDSHASAAEDEKLFYMLTYFDNETEKGKLYISYPMVEAIKHLKASIDFQNTLAKSERSYKGKVSIECDVCYIDLTSLKESHWKTIISEHCKKLGYILYDKFEIPDMSVTQLVVFEKQKEKFIDVMDKVAVLSAFPVFLADYYGFERFKS